MLNGKKKELETNLKSAFQSGFANASSSMTQLINNKAHFNDFHFGFYKMDSSEFTNPLSRNQNCSSLLITTEIFGELTGKSYFLVSEKEFEVLTHRIPQGRDPNLNLKEEFAKELDNILSASVITKLSNELNQKMYGDVPVLVGRIRSKIEDLIYDDFMDQTEEMYLISIFFSFENHPDICPTFIWAIDVSSYN